MPASRLAGLALVLSFAATSGCSSSRMVQVPPRLDLHGYRTVGLIDFSSPASPELRRQASQEFLTAVQSAQPGVAVLELGDADGVAESFRSGRVDPQAIRSLGEHYHVDAILFGVLEAKSVKPKVRVGSSIESLQASAEIEGLLNAKLFEAHSGATVWSTVARSKENVAALTLSEDGLSGIGANHPDDARDRLVTSLVSQATNDFRPTWIRQRE